MGKMGTLKQNGDQKSHFGPHGDQSPQMGTNVGAVGIRLNHMLQKYSNIHQPVVWPTEGRQLCSAFSLPTPSIISSASCNFEHCHLHPCNHRSSLRLRRILFFQRFLDFNDFQRDFLEPLSYSTEKRNKKGDLNPFTNLTPLLNSSKPSSYFGAWQRKIL